MSNVLDIPALRYSAPSGGCPHCGGGPHAISAYGWHCVFGRQEWWGFGWCPAKAVRVPVRRATSEEER